MMRHEKSPSNEFGSCACGAEAIVRLNGEAKCLECFGTSLRATRDMVDQSRRQL